MKLEQEVKTRIKWMLVVGAVLLYAIMATAYYVSIERQNAILIDLMEETPHTQEPLVVSIKHNSDLYSRYGKALVKSTNQLLYFSKECLSEMNANKDAWDESNNCIILRKGVALIEETFIRFSDEEISAMLQQSIKDGYLTDSEVEVFFFSLNKLWQDINTVKSILDAQHI